MINDGGHACLANFSLLMLAPDESTTTITCVEGGTFCWMSPELLDPETFGLTESRPTKESDCYALRMVAYEVLSREAPFTPNASPVVIRMILEGKHPTRPQWEGNLVTDAMWRVMEHCWKPQPKDRPTAKAVLWSPEGIQSSTSQHNGLQNCHAFHLFPLIPTKVQDARPSFHVLTMTFSLTTYFHIFYLIFSAHVMKGDNNDPKILYSGQTT